MTRMDVMEGPIEVLHDMVVDGNGIMMAFMNVDGRDYPVRCVALPGGRFTFVGVPEMAEAVDASDSPMAQVVRSVVWQYESYAMIATLPDRDMRRQMCLGKPEMRKFVMGLKEHILEQVGTLLATDMHIGGRKVTVSPASAANIKRFARLMDKADVDWAQCATQTVNVDGDGRMMLQLLSPGGTLVVAFDDDGVEYWTEMMDSVRTVPTRIRSKLSVIPRPLLAEIQRLCGRMVVEMAATDGDEGGDDAN